MTLFEERLNQTKTGFISTDKLTVADFAIWDKTITFFQHEHWKDAFGDNLKQFPLLKKH